MYEYKKCKGSFPLMYVFSNREKQKMFFTKLKYEFYIR